MPDPIEWMLVNDRFGDKKIGAVAFIGDVPAVVIGFFDDYDADSDGRVSAAEWVAGRLFPVSLAGTATLEVVSRAREQAILCIADGGSPERAAALSRMQASQFQSVGLSMALDGVFRTYMAPGISMAGSAIGTHIGAGAIKTFLIKKGMEQAAKAAFEAAVQERR